jgi:hypothetical protein
VLNTSITARHRMRALTLAGAVEEWGIDSVLEW